jgi:hypothetical protein
MTENKKFDSKLFLKNSYITQVSQSLNSGLQKSTPPLLTFTRRFKHLVYRILKNIIGKTFKPIVKPMAIRFRTFLIYQVANEINYAQQQQNKINNDILAELQKLRDFLEKNQKK